MKKMDFITYDLEYCKEHFHDEYGEIYKSEEVSALGIDVETDTYLLYKEAGELFMFIDLNESETLYNARRQYGDSNDTTIPIWSIKEFVSKETHPELYI